MHKNVRNRLIISLAILLLVSTGTYLLLYYLSDNIVFYITPSEVKGEHMEKKIRIGGLVKSGSVQKYNAGEYRFILTDEVSEIKVIYKGILPALFREGQGMVAEGVLKDQGEIMADKLLTKHDENYKPPTKSMVK